ncbi:unnamed protein product [Amoebophrya sp. A120]|nr:unnamed protein product [Amoebophrya sp. A120]|eukprot:GSA120T00003062001.1
MFVKQAFTRRSQASVRFFSTAPASPSPSTTRPLPLFGKRPIYFHPTASLSTSSASTTGGPLYSNKMPTDGLQQFVEAKNREYERLHKAFEEQFWGNKMALKNGDFSPDLLTSTKQAMEAWLANADNLKQTMEYLMGAKSDHDEKDLQTLEIFKRTFECYQMPPEVRGIRDEVTALESQLEQKRNGMSTGYDYEGKRVSLTSVALRQVLRNSETEAERKAAYQGIREIGTFITSNGFVEIIRKRNQLAKQLGYEDFYDYKVTQAEGFGKKKLFTILDDLESKTRATMEKAIKELKEKKGENAFEPWNLSFMLAGDLAKKQDPYFPFEKAVLRYAQCYANLGIQYEGAEMNLDLLDRPKKYSNGFCHWPQPAWVSGDKWIPSVANFTSLAIPSSVGSGKTALTTLMHEAGHAAHFANIKMGSPLFSQERAPTSVAYAENQSMFLDSLVDDADWKARYALDRDNKPMPFELIEESIRETHPFAVFMLRNMIAVPYFEKALYELTEDEMTAERVLSLADDVEKKICGGLNGRPLLSVPHIMSDESSCYYHGYVLAEMSVMQTRKYFLDKYGFLTDNAAIGPEITEAYWRCGNSVMFLDLVEKLTKSPLVADAWVADISEPVEEKIKNEKVSYDRVVNAKEPVVQKPLTNLNMRVRMVHGDEVISDSNESTIEDAAEKFEAYVKAM